MLVSLYKMVFFAIQTNKYATVATYRKVLSDLDHSSTIIRLEGMHDYLP